MKTSYFLFAFVLHLFFFMGCESETTDQGSGAVPTIDPISLSSGASTKFTVAISWTKYNSPLLSYYYVILKDEGGVEIERVKVGSNESTTNFIIGDTQFNLLEDGTNYIVEINAMDAANKILFPTEGYTGNLHIKNITTRNGANQIIPTKPSISFSSLTRQKVTVKWTESTTSDGSSIKYNLIISPSIPGFDFNGLTSLSANITGLNPNTEYSFKVVAVAGSDSEQRTNEDEAQITTLPPLGIINLTAEARGGVLDAGKVDISWNSQNAEGAINPRAVVTQGDDDGGNLALINVTSSSAVITGLQVGDHCKNPPGLASYTIRVYLSDGMEGEAKSSPVSFTMKSPGTPCPPN
jgi:hypothetical protein